MGNRDYEARLLPILKWPDDERLHEKCVDVEYFDDDIARLAYDMLHTMKSVNGVGLAAPQVGEMINMIAIWIEEDKPLIIINPIVVNQTAELFEFNEGCLSVPGYFEKRKRPEKITVIYRNANGAHCDTEFSGLYAFCVQHEIDHLEGKVFVDGSSLLKKSRIKSKMKKVARRK